MKRRLLTLLLVAVSFVAGATAAAQSAPADIPAANFAQLPLIDNPGLSPDGTHMAYFRPVRGRRFLIIQALFSDKKPKVLPAGETLDYDWVAWANDERLVFSMSYSDSRWLTETRETRLLSTDRSEGEIVPIIKAAMRKETGSRLSTVTLPPPQIQDNVIDWLPGEPHHILVSLDEDQDNKAEVRKVDIRNGDYDIYADGIRGVQRWFVDQEHVVRLGYGWDITDFTIMLKAPGGEWRRATRQGWWNAGFRPHAFTGDPAIAYAIGPDDNGYDVVRLLDVATGELGETVFAVDGYDVASILMERRGGLPVGASWTDDFRRHHWFDDELRVLQASVDKVFPDTVNELASWSADRRRVLVHRFSDVESGVYYLWDRDVGSMDFIAATRQGLPPELLAPVRPVTYAARDGLEIPAYLTLPLAAGSTPAEPLPTVVMPHGGPQSRSDREFWFLTQFLASRGYAVLQPNFRGSTGYGKPFENAGREEWGGKMQDDVTDGAEWLVAEGIADPERLCIVGWSYGGYSAAMGAVKTPELFRCAASINGVLNLPRLIADDEQYVGGRIWTQHIGLSDASARDVSPYHQAERIVAPMLIIQAEDDTRVHEDQGRRMAERLEDLDKPVRYVTVELGGHGMQNEAARLTILESLEAFLAAQIGAD